MFICNYVSLGLYGKATIMHLSPWIFSPAPADPVDLSGCCMWVGARQPTAAQYVKVVRDITSTTPDTDNRCPCRCRHSCSNDFCPWSGHLHWQWSLHENPGYTDGCRVLCCVTPASQHPPLGTRPCVSVTGCVIGTDKARLRQRDAYWPASLSVSSAAVGLNDAARLIYRRRRFDHFTSLLRELHWLKSSERVAYKLAVTYRCLHGLAPSYLAQSVRRVAELDRRRLRSSSSDDVIIPATRLVTVGDRGFTASGSRLWNSLPPDIRSAQTLHACFL